MKVLIKFVVHFFDSFPLDDINLVIDSSDKRACPCSVADYYNPAHRGVSHCNPITAYDNILNVTDCNHYVMSGQGDAIPLQAVG